MACQPHWLPAREMASRAPSNRYLVRQAKQEVTEGYPERPRSFPVIVLYSRAALSPQPRRAAALVPGRPAHSSQRTGLLLLERGGSLFVKNYSHFLILI